MKREDRIRAIKEYQDMIESLKTLKEDMENVNLLLRTNKQIADLEKDISDLKL